MLFWQCQTDISNEAWSTAVRHALPTLQMDVQDPGLIPYLTLGEGQFGPDHWRLSNLTRVYYLLKPGIPRSISRRLRSLISHRQKASFQLGWPIEDRYVRFLWETMRQLMLILGRQTIPFRSLWPDGHQFALVLTHDIETTSGLRSIMQIADLESEFGLRSSFNFVADRYPIDTGLLSELRHRGFEIGVHGLRHDGKLFSSEETFLRRAHEINEHLAQLKSFGFRSPLTHRDPHLLQALHIDYDLSFFDTDPFEPIPGGTMSIWPFFIGDFVELPYTLPQDYTLVEVLGETSPAIWLYKAEFIRSHHGMALINTHPDYLRNPRHLRIYRDFLSAMVERGGHWHALPRNAARWWRLRASQSTLGRTSLYESNLVLDEDQVRIEA